MEPQHPLPLPGGARGSGAGTLFKIDEFGTFTSLRSFHSSVDGANPTAPLALGSDGAFYFTASIGGPGNGGVVFRLGASRVPQTIRFASLPDRTFGDAPFRVSATASSGLPVSFGASGNCSIVGSLVTITGAGSCTVTAAQPGDPSYLAAPDVPQGFGIARAVPVLRWATPARIFAGTPLSATQLNAFASVPGTFAYTPPGTVLGVGVGQTLSVLFTATDGVTTRRPASVQIHVGFDFGGFESPVDNLPVLNRMKAGRAVPVKFSLGGNQGLNIFAAGYPTSRRIACNSKASIDPIEETVVAGSSRLTYQSKSSRYHYVWKTQKAWAGTCRQLVLKLTDGSLHRANFQLK